jgi:hypothetical protein
MHEQDTSTGLQRAAGTFGHRGNASLIEVIQHFRKQDQVEPPRRPGLRNAPAFEPDLRAKLARALQRRLRNVQGQQAVAALGQLRGQDADAAPDLQRVGKAAGRQGGEGGGVFLGFVGAAGEAPRIRVRGVEPVEIARFDWLGAPAQEGTSR